MLHPSDLDIRAQDHNRRVEHVNRYGWMGWNPISQGRKPKLGIVLAVATASRALIEFVCRDKGFDIQASPQTS